MSPGRVAAPAQCPSLADLPIPFKTLHHMPWVLGSRSTPLNDRRFLDDEFLRLLCILLVFGLPNSFGRVVGQPPSPRIPLGLDHFCGLGLCGRC